MTISKSEKTNAKNLENLHIANENVALITIYDTNNKLIQKTDLTNFETGFAARMQTVNEKAAEEKAAISAQTAAFKEVKTRVTQIVNAARGQSLSVESMAHLMTLVRKARGTRVTDKTPDNPATPDTDESQSNKSVSQQSIAGILDILDQIEEHLKNDAKYNPTEEKNTTDGINAWISGLRELRNDRLAAQAATVDARQDRDSYAYGDTGLIPRMNALKGYAGSILDKSDARYKAIKKLKFVDTTTK